MTCQHEDFEANVEVGRISAGDGGPIVSFVADITIMCADCRQSFGFRGLTPGMPADVYIKTGERTFFEYMMKPVFDSFSRAFRET